MNILLMFGLVATNDVNVDDIYNTLLFCMFSTIVFETKINILDSTTNVKF